MALVSGGGWDLADPFSGWPLGGALTRRGEVAPSLRPIRLDVIEKPDTFMIKGDIPGVDKKDIKLRQEGDMLSIEVQKQEGTEILIKLGPNRAAASVFRAAAAAAARGKLEESKEEAGWKMHRMERSQFWQRRTTRLPPSADLAKIQAKYDNGVLHIEVPKTEKKEAHGMDVTIS